MWLFLHKKVEKALLTYSPSQSSWCAFKFYQLFALQNIKTFENIVKPRNWHESIDRNQTQSFIDKCNKISCPTVWGKFDRSTHTTMNFFKDRTITIVGSRQNWWSGELFLSTRLVLFCDWCFWECKSIEHVFLCPLKNSIVVSEPRPCMSDISRSYKSGF